MMKVSINSIAKQNVLSWEAASRTHLFYKSGAEEFLLRGGKVITPELRFLLGDVSGKHIVHLYCSDGMESVQLALDGGILTGVDFAWASIEFARELSRRARVNAKFFHAEVFSWLNAGAQFRSCAANKVFLSYGTLWWVPDLVALFAKCFKILEFGGELIIADFHPCVELISSDWTMQTYECSTNGPHYLDSGIPDYYRDSWSTLVPWQRSLQPKRFVNNEPAVYFVWSINEVLYALKKAGFRLVFYQEFPYLRGEKLLPNMRLFGRNQFFPPRCSAKYPLMFACKSIKARVSD